MPNDSDSAEHKRLSRIAQAAEATASAIVITDLQGVIVWVNKGFTRITGYVFEEAVGRVPGHLLQGPDTDRAEANRIGAAVRARQSISSELVNYAKDGRRYWVGMKIEPLLAASGDIDGFMAIQADITERYEQRRALEQLGRRFDMATRAAHIGVSERDADWEILWWSDMMWEIFGQDPKTFKPTNHSWQALIHPEDRERIRETVALFMRTETASDTHYQFQYRIIRPDGQVRHILSVGAPVDPMNRRVDRFAGITVDVTERFEAQGREQLLQQQLRESAHHAGMAEIATGVLHNVGNILNSLGIANATARRDLNALRLDRLEEATSLLRSHRTELATFLTDDERGRHLPEYLPALSAQIYSHARTIQAELDTTNQLLHHLGNIVSAQQELARGGGWRESIQLIDLIETAVLVQASELAHVELVREYTELPPILTDRHKLLQILVNLIRNARDAVHANDTRQGRVCVRLSLDGQDHVVVTVEDSGIGMSPEVLAQIWNFGFTTKKNGHGFGLHNSANAAHEIGGTLTAHSEGPGTGSRFALRLPIDNPKPMLSGVAA